MNNILNNLDLFYKNLSMDTQLLIAYLGLYIIYYIIVRINNVDNILISLVAGIFKWAFIGIFLVATRAAIETGQIYLGIVNIIIVYFISRLAKKRSLCLI